MGNVMVDTQDDSPHQSDPLRRARLRWRARRGLLENDLIFDRFFSRYEQELCDADVAALTRLLELSDNELMDLLLARTEPEGDLATPDVIRLLGMLRTV
ncbi:succinate dehydrogenase assembly factor 2 [Caballeronia sp. LZ043]|uniref:FAD assembly factor SdhE n=1 Tax=Caballeronia sp. LZ043 TaxID=3038569 RepID=UPI002860F79F|nr:succinate dehydrogenase assembly factor 2 [Caballeronia sp. LZ043]MDR5825469.1 succinate dehydrogenase assembly factor 2 [Caballeronia sp. LZ043]